MRSGEKCYDLSLKTSTTSERNFRESFLKTIREDLAVIYDF